MVEEHFIWIRTLSLAYYINTGSKAPNTVKQERAVVCPVPLYHLSFQSHDFQLILLVNPYLL